MNSPAPPAQRQPRLTDPEIISTAEALMRETLAIPSDRDVLERLGRGSLSTVNKVMKQWRSQAAGKLLDRTGPELPEPVADAAREIWLRALTAARIEANAELAEGRARLNADRATFEGEANDLRQRNAGLQVAYDLEVKATAELRSEVSALREAGEELGRRVASLDVSLEMERNRADAECDRRTQAERQLGETQSALAETKSKAEGDLARLGRAHEAEVRLLVQRIEDQRARAERSEAAAAKAGQRAEERESALKDLANHLEDRRAELEATLATRQQEHALALDRLRQESENALQGLRREAEEARTEAATWKARAEERGRTQREAVPGPARSVQARKRGLPPKK